MTLIVVTVSMFSMHRIDSEMDGRRAYWMMHLEKWPSDKIFIESNEEIMSIEFNEW